MSILADKIEQFILTKLLEEQEGITLRRNELAETLDCAPSQISYVLSTRFSNDRGFIGHIDKVLFQYMKESRITKREAAMLHEAFVRILQDVPTERRKEAAERFYQAIMKIVNEEV